MSNFGESDVNKDKRYCCCWSSAGDSLVNVNCQNMASFFQLKVRLDANCGGDGLAEIFPEDVSLGACVAGSVLGFWKWQSLSSCSISWQPSWLLPYCYGGNQEKVVVGINWNIFK